MIGQNTFSQSVNKIVLMTNFRTLLPDTISMINMLNDSFENEGYKLLLLSHKVSEELHCNTIQIPFSLKDYSKINIDYLDINYNPNLISIDAEFNEDKEIDFSLYEKGLKKCSAFAHWIAKEVKPAISLLWSGTVPQSIIFKQVFSEYFIPTFYIERGLLAESLMIDESGNGALSSLKLHVDLNNNSSTYRQQYEILKNYYLEHKIDKHEQPNYVNAEDFIQEKKISGRKIILFVGQWDVASGVNSQYDYQSMLNSPYFKNTEDAFRELVKIIQEKNNLVLIFKPHPFDQNNYEILNSEKIIVDKKLNIRTLLEAADIISVMSSTVQYEALFYEKPIVLLANSFLSGHNIAYSILHRLQLESVLDEALNRVGFEEKIENGKIFISRIAESYLLSLNDQNPLPFSLNNAINKLLNKYSVPDIPQYSLHELNLLTAKINAILSKETNNKLVTEILIKANELINANEYYEAKKILVHILSKIAPDSIDAANDLAVCEILLGNYNEAENLLLQILGADPANDYAVSNYKYLKTLTEKR